ncbi:hypothetical protein [Melittangium boletus]|uniref:Lipoprotein n=1 Tax=Melittangium boletus DSM 14713 TaxID=1294270 RepID=A0A250IRH2_9BACT|nr:hypothetical protein [Melittangium boletus]ATB34339.1 hypothetical protein MEBOL_007840 [Melittangium boletus DSM 14713]
MRASSLRMTRGLALALLSLHCAHGGTPRLWLPSATQESQVLGLTSEARDFFVIGAFSGALDWEGQTPVSRGAEDVFVARLEPSGTVRWLRHLGGAGQDTGDAVTLSTEDSLIAVGMFSGPADFGEVSLQGQGDSDCFVSKLSREDGRVLWARAFGGQGGVMSCRSVASDASGDLFVTGRFTGTVTPGTHPLQSAGMNDLFLLKLSGRDGALQWARHFGGAGEDIGRDVAVAPSGTVLLTGLFSQGVAPEPGAIDFGTGKLMSQGDADAFLAAFSPDDGHALWSRAFGGPSYDQSKSVVVAEDGGIYLTGLFQREDVAPGAEGLFFTAGGFEGFLAGFSPLGVERWRHRWPAMVSGHSLALSPGGQLVLAGHFEGSLDLGPGVKVESLGRSDAVVAGFSTTGQAVWARRFGGTGNDYGYAVAASEENVGVGGVLSRPLAEGPLVSTSFIARLRAAALDTHGE